MVRDGFAGAALNAEHGKYTSMWKSNSARPPDI